MVHTRSFGSLCLYRKTQKTKTQSFESFVFWVVLHDFNDPYDPGPLLRNHKLGGKFQKGDLIFDTRNISLYELLSKACNSYKT